MDKMTIATIIMFSTLGGCSGFCFQRGLTRSNMEYATGTKVSIKEDSVTGRRPTYFFGLAYINRRPSGGGIGVGK